MIYYYGTERPMRVGDRVVGRGSVDSRRLDGLEGVITHVNDYEDDGDYACHVDFGSFDWWVYSDSIIPADAVVNWLSVDKGGCRFCGCKITPEMKLSTRLYSGEVCDRCVAREVKKVHSYHFGKNLKYNYAKGKITLGAEIEIDDRDEEGSREDAVFNLVDYACKHKYPLIMTHENDGSLYGDGFESVTAPLTLDEWKTDAVIGQLNTLFESAEESGFNLHDNYTHAGLHVHIGRKDLCGDMDVAKTNAVGLLMGWAVTRLWNKGFKELSRRRDLEYCHLFDESGHGNGLHDTEGSYNRYSAVNITNAKTIELRIFAGARNVDDVLVAVDVCYMLAKWAVKKITAYSKRSTYSVKAGRFDDALEYADRLTWSALVKYSKFPEVTLPAMREAGIVF